VAKRSTTTTASHPAASVTASSVSNALDLTPEVLNLVLELPEDVEEGTELHDNGEVQVAVATALNKTKVAPHCLIVPDDQLKEGRDLFPKVNVISLLSTSHCCCAYTHISLG
jgi:hypothetical protein